ncbi:transmembrane protein, putative, partial [Rhizoctonia solani AG-3 Rhs1AP]
MSWPTFHTQHPIKELVVSDGDMKLATLAFGWTIGFGYFVTWHAIQQTKRLNAFIVMVWGEILVCAIFAILSWLHLCGVIKYSFWLYFTILINVSISYRCHLNFMFIRSIKQRLLKVGLKKYDKLVKFNEKIIAVSLAMDVLIITMMSHPNDSYILNRVSCFSVQFHPVAYIVKLEIEMCMSKLMVKVATGTGITIYGGDTLQVSRSKSSTGRDQNTNQSQTGNSVDIRVATHTVTHTDQLENDRGSQELESRIEFDDPKARRLSTLRAAATNRQPTVVRGNHNRSQTIELEVYSPDSQARDYDSDSRSQSSKYPRSWIEEPTYTPNSATQLSESTIAIKDLDVDLERGDAFPDDDDGGATGELFRRTSKT